MNKAFLKTKPLASWMLVIIMLFALIFPVSAKSVPERPQNFYLYDEAGVLSDSVYNELIALNDELFYQCGGEIGIVVLNSLGGEEISSFAEKIFDTWDLGSAENQNGLLLLLAIDEQDYWSLCGKGTEKFLTAGDIGEILDTYLEPYFAVEDYETGIVEAFGAFVETYEEYYSVTVSLSAAQPGGSTQDDPYIEERPVEDDSSGDGAVLLFFIILIIVLIILFSSRRGRRTRVFFMPRPPRPPRPPMPPPPAGGGFGGPRPGSGFGRPTGTRPGGSFGSRPSGGFGSRPTSSRPSGGFSRPSGGFSRPSGGFSRPSGGGFSRGGGGSRGGGAGRGR